jgi:hypothetical protein
MRDEAHRSSHVGSCNNLCGIRRHPLEACRIERLVDVGHATAPIRQRNDVMSVIDLAAVGASAPSVRSPSMTYGRQAVESSGSACVVVGSHR